MHDSEMLDTLQQYIAQEVLEGESVGLDADTPLLAMGILNSFEIIKFLSFIETQFDVTVPMDKVLGENLENLNAIANLVADLRQTGS